MRNSGIKFKMKKRLKFRHVYAIILMVITAYFAYHVIELLVFTPMRAQGTMILGSRMEEIEPLNEEWLRDTETFGANVNRVDYVSVFWNRGPVVYVNIRLEERTSTSNVREAANTVVGHFVGLAGSVIRPYSIQVVVSYGDIGELRDENQEALIQHVHEYNHEFVESLIRHAQTYPSPRNIDRARNNISDAAGNMYESVVIVVGEEGRREMLERINAITPASDEDLEEGPMPEHAMRQIPRSEINRFPMWGTWNHRRDRIRWNPNPS